MNPQGAISTPSGGVVCKTLSKPCKTFLGNEVISNTSVGNGVTVAFQILGYRVEILQPFYQTPPFLIRLFPGTSSSFARKFAPVRSNNLSGFEIGHRGR